MHVLENMILKLMVGFTLKIINTWDWDHINVSVLTWSFCGITYMYIAIPQRLWNNGHFVIYSIKTFVLSEGCIVLRVLSK